MFQKLEDGSILNKQVFGGEKAFDLANLREEIQEEEDGPLGLNRG